MWSCCRNIDPAAVGCSGKQEHSLTSLKCIQCGVFFNQMDNVLAQERQQPNCHYHPVEPTASRKQGTACCLILMTKSPHNNRCCIALPLPNPIPIPLHLPIANPIPPYFPQPHPLLGAPFGDASWSCCGAVGFDNSKYHSYSGKPVNYSSSIVQVRRWGWLLRCPHHPLFPDLGLPSSSLPPACQVGLPEGYHRASFPSLVELSEALNKTMTVDRPPTMFLSPTYPCSQAAACGYPPT